jgi:hypothetical protein
MSYTMLHKIGKSDEDLTQTDMMLMDFKGNVSPAQGAICVELTIGMEINKGEASLTVTVIEAQGWTYD